MGSGVGFPDPGPGHSPRGTNRDNGSTPLGTAYIHMIPQKPREIQYLLYPTATLISIATQTSVPSLKVPSSKAVN